MPQFSSVHREEESPEIAAAIALLLERHSQVVSEREAASDLFKDLLARPSGERDLAAITEDAFHVPALSELLAERSEQAAGADALELARLAVEVADQLEPERHGASLVYDMRVRAWTQLAKAKRLGGDLGDAEMALQQAEKLAEGSADPLEEGRLLQEQAALLVAQGFAEEAIGLYEDAAEIYERLEERERSAAVRLEADSLANSPRPSVVR